MAVLIICLCKSTQRHACPSTDPLKPPAKGSTTNATNHHLLVATGRGCAGADGATARWMEVGVALFQAHAEKQQQAQGGEECAHPAPAGGHPEALQCSSRCHRKDGRQGGQGRQACPPESQAQGTGCAGGSRATAAAAGTGNVAGAWPFPLSRIVSRRPGTSKSWPQLVVELSVSLSAAAFLWLQVREAGLRQTEKPGGHFTWVRSHGRIAVISRSAWATQ